METAPDGWPIIDDVGSFPLPSYISPAQFAAYYWDAFAGILQQADVAQNQGLWANILHPIESSVHAKWQAGIEVINYPQLMDMYTQFLHPISLYSGKEHPYLIDPTKACILEIPVVERWAQLQYEQVGHPLSLKVCVTGPLELYFKQMGFTIYPDLALNFARTVNAFLRNSLRNTKYLRTEVVAIDEPSFGYVTTNGASAEDLIQIYDTSTANLSCDVQIHLHSLNHAHIPLATKHINILTCEYASNPDNLIDRQALERADKFIRVGITRTNFNAILADALDSGTQLAAYQSIEGLRRLIDPPDRIRQTLHAAFTHYGDRLKYVGPDCGLSAWAPPDLAQELLTRTAAVVKEERPLLH